MQQAGRDVAHEERLADGVQRDAAVDLEVGAAAQRLQVLQRRVVQIGPAVPVVSITIDFGRYVHQTTRASRPAPALYGEAQGRELAILRSRDGMKLDCGGAAALEETDTIAEENRCDVHDEFVRQPCVETLPSDGCAQDPNVSAVGGLLDDGDGLFDSDVEESPRHALHDRRICWWVVAKGKQRAR